jgi:ABC-type sulfate transport system permease subunit
MQTINVTRQDDHLRLVAIFHLVGGAFAICVALFFSCSIGSVASQIREANPSDAALLALILAVVIAAAAIVSPVLSALCIATHNFRFFSILVSVLFLPFFPIGTAIGIYSLWILTSPITKLRYAAIAD